MKFVEYKAKWEEALLPGKYYRPTEPPPGVNMPSFEKEKEKALEKAAEKSAGPVEAKPQAATAVPASGGGRALDDCPLGDRSHRTFAHFGSIAASFAARSSGTARSRTTCSFSSASTSQ